MHDPLTGLEPTLPHLQDCKVPVCSTCGRGKDDSPWCSNGFHFGGKPRPTMPIQATPAPSSLAESAGEGGLNSDCKVSTQTVQSPAATATDVAGEDAEVERVARAMWECQERSDGWEIVHRSVRDAYRTEALAAIRAIREGKRWGVWCDYLQQWRCRFGSKVATAFVTSDREAAQHAADEWNSRRGLSADDKRCAEVRPYTPARAKTPEDGGAKAQTALDTAIAALRELKSLPWCMMYPAAIRDASKESK
jgi:hypothetical protein